MSDYTPTTEEVRNALARITPANDHSIKTADFDRWLAEVKAQAWEEGAKCAYDNFHLWEYRNRKDYFPEELNPYRQDAK